MLFREKQAEAVAVTAVPSKLIHSHSGRIMMAYSFPEPVLGPEAQSPDRRLPSTGGEHQSSAVAGPGKLNCVKHSRRCS